MKTSISKFSPFLYHRVSILQHKEYFVCRKIQHLRFYLGIMSPIVILTHQQTISPTFESQMLFNPFYGFVSNSLPSSSAEYYLISASIKSSYQSDDVFDRFVFIAMLIERIPILRLLLKVFQSIANLGNSPVNIYYYNVFLHNSFSLKISCSSSASRGAVSYTPSLLRISSSTSFSGRPNLRANSRFCSSV